MKCRPAVVATMLGCLAAAMTACSSSGPSGNYSTSSPPPSVPSSSLPAATSATAAPAPNLKSQLLTVAELPTGWAVDNSSDSSSVSTPSCVKNFKSKLKTTIRAELSFVRGTDLPSFDQQLAYYGASATALAKYKAGAAILNNCTDVSFKSDGHTYKGSIGALSFPKLGEQSSAWQLVLSTQGVTVGLDLVLVAKGSELSLTLYGDLGSPDVDDATSLNRKAVAKMP